VFIILSIGVPILANGLRALGIMVLAHLEGSAAAVEADHILYGWFFFTLVIILLIAIGMMFAQKIDRRAPAASGGWSNSPTWRFATVIPAAVLLALAGPAYAARLDALYPEHAFPPPRMPMVSMPWQPVRDAGVDWRPAVIDADREFLESFEGPGSDRVTRYIALYRLRVIGNSLTRTGNRVADDIRWHIVGYGRNEITLAGAPTAVASTEIVSGQRHQLVWSFYVVDGKIAVGLIEAKLLQARAVLLQRAPLGAFVAISASMDDPGNPAERQLTRFLAASEPFPRYIASLAR
jgi:EpsI family protein